MIKSFYTVGKILSQIPEYADYFRPWANPFPKVRGEAKVIVAEINDSVLMPELKLEDFRTELVDKYLFREAKANATNLVPTFYVQPQAEPEKQADSIRKMIKKVRQSVLNYKPKFVTPEQVNQIEQMLLMFPLSTAASYLFTMRIDGRYFGDFKEYQELFVSDAYQKYRKDSFASDQVYWNERGFRLNSRKAKTV
jgi:hypothetical protein